MRATHAPQVMPLTRNRTSTSGSPAAVVAKETIPPCQSLDVDLEVGGERASTLVDAHPEQPAPRHAQWQ